MPACCIGGVCIPYSAVWPLLMFVAKYLWEKFGSVICRIFGITSSKVEESQKTYADVEPSEVPHVNSASDWQTLISESSKHQPLIVDFTAKWCRPCQTIKPFFGRLATKYADKATFVAVDIDQLDEVAADSNISAVPTFQAYLDGKLIGTVCGVSESKLMNLVDDSITKKQ